MAMTTMMMMVMMIMIMIMMVVVVMMVFGGDDDRMTNKAGFENCLFAEQWMMPYQFSSVINASHKCRNNYKVIIILHATSHNFSNIYSCY